MELWMERQSRHCQPASFTARGRWPSGELLEKCRMCLSIMLPSVFLMQSL